MSPEYYSCDLDPETGASIRIYLFKNVKNVEVIRNNIINGIWNCAIIKPSLILDPFQVAVAANRAVLAQKHSSMVTRTIYAEILFNLSLSKNISQSLSKFGMEKDRELLVCFIVTSESVACEDILSQIEGELCPMTELGQFTQEQDVKQTYKLNNYKCKDRLLDVVVSRMVTKSFVSH